MFCFSCIDSVPPQSQASRGPKPPLRRESGTRALNTLPDGLHNPNFSRATSDHSALPRSARPSIQASRNSGKRRGPTDHPASRRNSTHTPSSPRLENRQDSRTRSFSVDTRAMQHLAPNKDGTKQAKPSRPPPKRPQGPRPSTHDKSSSKDTLEKQRKPRRPPPKAPQGKPATQPRTSTEGKSPPKPPPKSPQFKSSPPEGESTLDPSTLVLEKGNIATPKSTTAKQSPKITPPRPSRTSIQEKSAPVLPGLEDKTPSSSNSGPRTLPASSAKTPSSSKITPKKGLPKPSAKAASTSASASKKSSATDSAQSVPPRFHARSNSVSALLEKFNEEANQSPVPNSIPKKSRVPPKRASAPPTQVYTHRPKWNKETSSSSPPNSNKKAPSKDKVKRDLPVPTSHKPAGTSKSVPSQFAPKKHESGQDKVNGGLPIPISHVSKSGVSVPLASNSKPEVSLSDPDKINRGLPVPVHAPSSHQSKSPLTLSEAEMQISGQDTLLSHGLPTRIHADSTPISSVSTLKKKSESKRRTERAPLHDEKLANKASDPLSINEKQANTSSNREKHVSDRSNSLAASQSVKAAIHAAEARRLSHTAPSPSSTASGGTVLRKRTVSSEFTKCAQTSFNLESPASDHDDNSVVAAVNSEYHSAVFSDGAVKTAQRRGKAGKLLYTAVMSLIQGFLLTSLPLASCKRGVRKHKKHSRRGDVQRVLTLIS